MPPSERLSAAAAEHTQTKAAIRGGLPRALWIRGHSRRVSSLAGEAAALAASTSPPARTCGGRGSFTTSAGSPSRTGSGTSRVRSRPPVGAGAAPRVLHRADPSSLRSAGVHRRTGVAAPRASRRVRVPPLAPRRGPVAHRSDHGRRGRVRMRSLAWPNSPTGRSRCCGWSHAAGRTANKTLGRHVENLYREIGVSSRPAAAVFAMEHRLLD